MYPSLKTCMYIHRQVNHSIYRLVSLGGFFMVEEFTDLLDLVKTSVC